VSEPRVSSGLRGSKDRGDLSEQTPQSPAEGVAPAREGEAVFISDVAQYRMTLWVDWEKVTYTSSGRRQPDRRDVQFMGGVYRTRDAREIEAIRASSTYGVHVHDMAELAALGEESRMNAALAAADDPAIAEALKVKLGVKDVAMPARQKATPTGE